jgi:hypothetical protein
VKLLKKVLAVACIIALSIVFFQACAPSKQTNQDKGTLVEKTATESTVNNNEQEPKENVSESNKAIERIEAAPKDMLKYTNSKYKFSVTFPKSWGHEFEKTWEATSQQEASPDGGIRIYIEGNKEEMIYVYGQNGHIGVFQEASKREEFFTDSNIKGELSSVSTDGKQDIHLVLGDGFNGAHVYVSEECFNSNKDEIFNLLKSIELID